MTSKVYIIIVNWNGWEDTIECLESVFRNKYDHFEVIVCDNASSDHSMEKIKLWADGKIFANVSKDARIFKNTLPAIDKPISYIEYKQAEAEKGGLFQYPGVKLILIQNDENLGFAGGNNVAIKYALQKNDFTHVWILNNDTVIDNKALVYLMEKAQHSLDIGLCGSLLYYYQEPDSIQAISGCYNKFLGISKYNTHLLQNTGIDYVVGASMLISRSFFERIGILNEEYFLYYEEMDLVMRSRGIFKQAYEEKSIVYHKEGASIGGKDNPTNKSELSDFYSIKNRVLFTKKYFPFYLPIVYLGLIVSIFNRLRRRQYSRVKMIFFIIWKNPRNYFFYISRRKE